MLSLLPGHFSEIAGKYLFFRKRKEKFMLMFPVEIKRVQRFFFFVFSFDVDQTSGVLGKGTATEL